MKLFKRLASMVLAMVMIVTTLSLGFTSMALIQQSKADVTVSIVVPETIYLKPGTSQMQYYIAGAATARRPQRTRVRAVLTASA